MAERVQDLCRQLHGLGVDITQHGTCCIGSARDSQCDFCTRWLPCALLASALRLLPLQANVLLRRLKKDVMNLLPKLRSRVEVQVDPDLVEVRAEPAVLHSPVSRMWSAILPYSPISAAQSQATTIFPRCCTPQVSSMAQSSRQRAADRLSACVPPAFHVHLSQ